MSPICPQLTQLYQAWSDSLTVVTSARLRYQETASIEDKKAFEQVLLQAKKAQENYREVAYTLIHFRASPLVKIEALVMGGIDLLLRDSNRKADVVINQDHVKVLNINSSDASALSINQVVALAVSYLPGLKMLDCYNSDLSMLPDALPDSLEYIDIQRTPVAIDLKVQKKLKAFQVAHPGTIVVF